MQQHPHDTGPAPAWASQSPQYAYYSQFEHQSPYGPPFVAQHHFGGPSQPVYAYPGPQFYQPPPFLPHQHHPQLAPPFYPRAFHQPQPPIQAQPPPFVPDFRQPVVQPTLQFGEIEPDRASFVLQASMSTSAIEFSPLANTSAQNLLNGDPAKLGRRLSLTRGLSPPSNVGLMLRSTTSRPPRSLRRTGKAKETSGAAFATDSRQPTMSPQARELSFGSPKGPDGERVRFAPSPETFYAPPLIAASMTSTVSTSGASDQPPIVIPAPTSPRPGAALQLRTEGDDWTLKQTNAVQLTRRRPEDPRTASGVSFARGLRSNMPANVAISFSSPPRIPSPEPAPTPLNHAPAVPKRAPTPASSPPPVAAAPKAPTSPAPKTPTSPPPVASTSAAAAQEVVVKSKTPPPRSITPVQTPPSAMKKATPAATPSGAKKSWAELLRSPDSALKARPGSKRVSILEPSSQSSTAPPSAPLSPTAAAASTMSPSEPARRRMLEEVLAGVELKAAAPRVYPRGLVNKGNLCFQNAVLQMLVFCGPLFNLLRLLGQELALDEALVADADKFGCLLAMIAFAKEFRLASKEDRALPMGKPSTTINGSTPGANARSDWSDPFVPQAVYDALQRNDAFEVMRQEDAEEFLRAFLNALHDELLALIDRQQQGTAPRTNGVEAAKPAPAQSADDGDEDWLEVGPGNRAATTRSRDSAITKIFGGQVRSILRVANQKDSATIEPYMFLQLDIDGDSIETIEDAFVGMAAAERLSDFSREASKQVLLESLPPVLIVHLKRFTYDRGTTKTHRVIGFGSELEIPASVISSGRRQALASQRKYQLSAVVYHHGRYATGGHYTTALRQQHGQWIHVDDTTVTPIKIDEVTIDRTREKLRLSLPSAHALDGVAERTAYLLTYVRRDL